MNELMKLYLKIFVAFFILFALPSGILCFFLFDDSSFGLKYALYASAAIGIIASVWVGSAHIFSVRRWSFLKSNRSIGVRHVRKSELQLPYDRAFKLCAQSLSSIGNYRIEEEDQVQGTILAKAGLYWKGNRDIVSFGLHKISDDRTDVEVSSRPTLRTVLVDSGRNLDNVERLTKFLDQNS